MEAVVIVKVHFYRMREVEEEPFFLDLLVEEAVAGLRFFFYLTMSVSYRSYRN